MMLNLANDIAGAGTYNVSISVIGYVNITIHVGVGVW